MTTIFLLQEMTWKTEESGVCADRERNLRKGKVNVRLWVKLYEAAVRAFQVRSLLERAS